MSVTAGGRQVTRWGRFRAWWLHHPGLDADHYGILAALATYADDNGYCEPSQATLARLVKRSRPWVNRVIGDLACAGILTKQVRSRGNGGNTSCRYRLADLPPDSGVCPVTSPVPAHDSPCHVDDRNQHDSKHTQDARPAQAAAPVSENLHEIEAGWQPGNAIRDEALRVCPNADLESHTALFVSRSMAKGYRYRPGSEERAWLAWLIEDTRKHAVRLGSRSRTGGTGEGRYRKPETVQEDRLAAWGAAAAAPALSGWNMSCS
jgi:hypothetical protein